MAYTPTRKRAQARRLDLLRAHRELVASGRVKVMGTDQEGKPWTNKRRLQELDIEIARLEQ